MSEAVTPDLIAGLRRLIDKDAIRDVLHRYCRGVDRCDLELLKSCYWPDSYDDHGRFFAGNGHAFCEAIVPVLQTIERTVHALSNILIDFDGDRAFSECQWTILHRFREPDAILDWRHQGRYLDILEKRDGEWRILVHKLVKDADRLHVTQDIGDAMMAAGVVPSDEPIPVDWGARYPDDPVYRAFGIGDDRPERPAAPAEGYWDALRLLRPHMTEKTA
jgi:hypothetical protein